MTSSRLSRKQGTESRQKCRVAMRRRLLSFVTEWAISDRKFE
jgi:hypothetical protein